MPILSMAIYAMYKCKALYKSKCFNQFHSIDVTCRHSQKAKSFVSCLVLYSLNNNNNNNNTSICYALIFHSMQFTSTLHTVSQ